VVGRWFLATLLSERRDRQKLEPKLNGGKRGWDPNESAVVRIACELATRRYFDGTVDIYKISKFVGELRGKIHSTMPPGQRETEAVIRRALGDADVIVGDHPLGIVNIQGAVVAQVRKKLGLTNGDVSQLIVDAECLAIEQGWTPPLVP